MEERSNVIEPTWEHELVLGTAVLRATRVGHRAGARRLGATLYELGHGAAASPLHSHHANEELLVVLTGRPTLRTAAGQRRLSPGEVVAFPAGAEGAHRVENREAEPARVLMISTMVRPDVVEHPSSRKILTFTGDPDEEPGPDTVHAFRVLDRVHPMEGESRDAVP